MRSRYDIVIVTIHSLIEAVLLIYSRNNHRFFKNSARNTHHTLLSSLSAPFDLTLFFLAKINRKVSPSCIHVFYKYSNKIDLK